MLRDESQSFVYGGSLRALVFVFYFKNRFHWIYSTCISNIWSTHCKNLINTLVLLSLSTANITQARKTSQSLTRDRKNCYPTSKHPGTVKCVAEDKQSTISEWQQKITCHVERWGFCSISQHRMVFEMYIQAHRSKKQTLTSMLLDTELI